ncbi:hypothetical protein R3W88_027142 [Solanum pinnatisectum]|uniref:Variable outer membrane protein n=1 Tax=Solanum pinnatisectum TaxID=50273 RepID=A0AAV9LGF9_9SOLN|nr:hypothetical protein R3W88_027142 [Solanum pinnatisectum]
MAIQKLEICIEMVKIAIEIVAVFVDAVGTIVSKDNKYSSSSSTTQSNIDLPTPYVGF